MELELTEYLRYAAALFFVLALIGLTVWVLKRFSGGKLSASGRQGRRLGIMEAAMVDKHRRLVLIRRDDREHLIMIGGPQDLVIETGIEAASLHRAEAQPAAPMAPDMEPQAHPEPYPPAQEEPVQPRRAPIGEPRERPGRLSERPPMPPRAPREPAPRENTPRRPELPRTRLDEPASPSAFSSRAAPEGLKPDPLKTDPPSLEPIDRDAQGRSMLNVRPGDTK